MAAVGGLVPIAWLDGESLTVPTVAAVARRAATPKLAEGARARMERSAGWVDRAARGELVDADGNSLQVYGVNTGYGSLARVRIDQDRIRELSWNLVRSHAAGVGPPVPQEQ